MWRGHSGVSGLYLNSSKKIVGKLPKEFQDFLQYLSEGWVWRFNVYYDTDMLILAIALDPRHKFKSLSESTSYDSVFNKLKSFADRYCQDIMQVGTEKKASQAKKLVNEYIAWFHAEGHCETNDTGNPVPIEAAWINFMDLKMNLFCVL